MEPLGESSSKAVCLEMYTAKVLSHRVMCLVLATTAAVHLALGQ